MFSQLVPGICFAATREKTSAKLMATFSHNLLFQVKGAFGGEEQLNFFMIPPQSPDSKPISLILSKHPLTD